MKILLTLFVLFFSSSVFSKDVFDYEIDGLRVGDTLLRNFSENEIINAYNYDHLPSSMKFRIIELKPKSNSVFDTLQFFYKPDDIVSFLRYSSNSRYTDSHPDLRSSLFD